VIEKYRIRWKLTTDSEWLEFTDIPPSGALCREEEVDLVCHTLTDLLAQENYTIQVQTFNAAVPQGSPWSVAVSHVAQAENEADGDDDGPDHVLTVFAVLAVVVAAVLTAFLVYRCYVKRQRRRKGFDRVLSQEEYRKPIIRNGGGQMPPAAPHLLRHPVRKATSNNAHHDRSSMENAAARRSCLDPLPPLPGEEPIYSDLELKHGASQEYLAHSPLKKRAEEEEDDEEGYLAPNPVRVASRESLDEEGYLRPNFNRFQRLDTTRPGFIYYDPSKFGSASSRKGTTFQDPFSASPKSLFAPRIL
jgi:hypothetical protein